MENEIAVIAPQGRLDAAGAQPLEADLNARLAAGQARVIVDFANTRYIGSNSLRVLLAAQKRAQHMGGAIKLCCLAARLKEIFAMAGLDRVFEIFETRAEAERSFRD